MQANIRETVRQKLPRIYKKAKNLNEYGGGYSGFRGGFGGGIGGIRGGYYG